MKRTQGNLPEPQWSVLPTPGQAPSGEITPRLMREAENFALYALGRKWTPNHRLAAIKYLCRNGHLPWSEFEAAKEEFTADRDKQRQIRREAGLPTPQGLKITSSPTEPARKPTFNHTSPNAHIPQGQKHQ